MKYVAFLDVLGFKQTLKSLNQDNAEQFISELSSLLYRIWDEKNAQKSQHINGYIVSDSIIVYTNNDKPCALQELLEYILEVCKRAFIEQSILFRCGIAKGDFNYLKAHSFENLQKGLIVGQAYVDAYLLEDQAKVSAIIADASVANDIKEHTSYDIDELKGKSHNTCFTLKWATIDLLLDSQNMKNYIALAQKAEWLPHYYNTLYLFLSGTKNEKKQYQVFENVINVIANGDKGQNYRAINKFIENAFSSDVEYNFKQMFLKYLREKL